MAGMFAVGAESLVPARHKEKRPLTNSVFDFRVLGGIDLIAPDGRDLNTLLRQSKRIALLAYLSIAGRSAYLRRDKLVALFWPEYDDERARASLRTTIHALRSTLGEDAVIVRGVEEIRLNDSVVRCDANVLLDAAEMEAWQSVLDAYRGALLDGFFVKGCAPEFGEWVENNRRRLGELASDAAWKLADQHRTSGKIFEAIAFARRAQEIAPLDEHAIRRLLSLQLEGGDRAAALTEYEEYARRLASDFQIEPSSETTALVKGLRGGSAPPQSRTIVQPVTPTATANPGMSAISGEARAVQPPAGPIAASLPPASDSRRVGIEASRKWWYALAIPVLFLLYAGVALTRTRSTALNAAPAWEQLSVEGPEPLARSHAIAILDSSGRSMLIFGGRASETNVGDLWRLNGFDSNKRARWTRVRTAGNPSSEPRERFLAAAAYNPRTDRMILFGGAFGYTAPCTDELWVLTNASGTNGTPRWKRIAHPPGAQWPAPRAEHAVAYDEKSNRLMLYGGHDCVAPVYTDYWVLHDADGTTGTPSWERITPDSSGGAPREPRGQAMAFSPASNRLIVFGGFDYRKSEFLNETWILTNANGLGATPTWKRVNLKGPQPTGRIHTAFGFDPSTNRLLVTFGIGKDGLLSDTWVLAGADGTPLESRWIPLTPGFPQPSLRQNPAALFDPIGNRLIIFGGESSGRSIQDVWVLHDATGR
jgi:DNA-binding SARP family transcriptional activator